MAEPQQDEKAQHADDCLRVTSSSAAACSCGADRAARIAERDAWQNGLAPIDLTPEEFDSLLEYSTTLPTGKTIGKRWKRYLHIGPKRGSWVLGEYIEDAQPDLYVGITWREIRVLTTPGHLLRLTKRATEAEALVARARILNCLDPLAVGAETKQQMLDALRTRPGTAKGGDAR